MADVISDPMVRMCLGSEASWIKLQMELGIK